MHIKSKTFTALIAKIADTANQRTLTVRFALKDRLYIKKNTSLLLDGVYTQVAATRGLHAIFHVSNTLVHKTTLKHAHAGDLLTVVHVSTRDQEANEHATRTQTVTRGEIVARESMPRGCTLTILASNDIMHYIFEHMPIAINGILFNVHDIDVTSMTFRVTIQSEKIDTRLLFQKTVGHEVNITAEAIIQKLVDNAEQLLILEHSDLHQQYLDQMRGKSIR